MISAASPPRARLAVRHLWSMVAVAALAVRVTFPIRDNSFLWHVRAGTVQLEAGEVLRSDPFTFTRTGEAWRTQSWLAELLYGWLENATGGLGWVPWMIFVAGALTLGLAGVAVYERARSVSASALAVIVLFWTGSVFFVPRPVVLSFPLIVLVALVAIHRERLAWLVVPVMWTWAALHGSVVVGIALAALLAWRHRSRQLVVATTVGAVATLFTAHGLGAWTTIGRFFASREALSFLSEWRPPDFTNPALVPFLAVVAALFLAVAGDRVERRDLLVVVPFLLFGLTSERSVFPAMLVLAPYAASAWPVPTAAPRQAGWPVLNWVILGLLVVASVGSLAARPGRVNDTVFPSDALLAGLEPVGTFHGVSEGGYLIYARWPQVLVYVDDRAELHGSGGFQEFVDTRDGVDWEATFARRGFTQAIVRSDWPIAALLRSAGWTTAVDEGDFILLQRRVEP